MFSIVQNCVRFRRIKTGTYSTLIEKIIMKLLKAAHSYIRTFAWMTLKHHPIKYYRYMQGTSESPVYITGYA